ncbi:uncharacterized protein LOC128681260 isoform X5 [Plodia interpunctella]|uniref:uncharacterized protein LOC128681260 isoform X5 n=1 Tax=Plodia interpunctella TaxID=58824 RepID=UPI002368A439|nr:uncharacterized protein LOC128681260 isoform X5 [Plodia interpunctella]
MMLTIHGLPSVANYQDVRTLLQRECNLNDFILDNLVNDKNGTKKVRIGVADEMEGAHVIKCLDGFRCGGKVLYVIPVGKQVPPSNQAQAFNPQGNNYPMQSNQYGPPDQVGPWSGQVSDQWAPNVAQVGGYDYSQQNVPFQQQPQHPQRGLNQRELMLQASRGPVQEPYANRPGNVPKQNLGPLASRPALRNIETVDLPKGGPDRFQNYEQPKPITIKKDNFMGPNQFSGNNPQGSYTQGHVQTPWMDQCPQHKQSSYKPSQPYEDDKKFQPKAGILKTPICDREKYNEKPHYSPQRDSPGRRSSPRRNMSPGRRMPPSNDQRMPRDGRAHLDHLSGSNDKMGHNDRRIPMKDDRLGPNDRRIDDRMGSNDRRMPISDRMGPNDRRIPTDDRMGPNDRRMPISDRMGPNDRRMPTDDRMGPNDRRMVPKDDRMVVLNSGRRISPPGRRVSPPGRRISPSGRRISPSRKRMSPTGRRFSPSGRISPSGRLISPGRRDGPMNRHISPPGRRISPPGRHVSPAGRRISSPGRHISPLGRRISPPGRRISPPGRRISPSNKRVSPDRRMRSPVRRSPNRRLSQEPHARSMRYSPGRHPDKDRPKQVRPAYEPDTKAANQAMYSGGYRPNAHEPPTQYRAVVPGAERISPWQDRDNSRDKFAVKKNDDLRRDLIMSKIADEKRISPRASRSPHRRDRSPIRDRYRRHSPSPRSPRRSWALEKRRSPEHDAPPPPAWPGQPQEYPRSNRDKDEKGPVWEKSFVKMEDEFPPDTIRVRKDLMHSGGAHREPSPHRFKQEDRIDDRYREPKFERDDYHDRRFEPDRKKLPDREEFIARSERAHEQLKKKEELPKHQPRLDQYRKKHEQIEEEFQDVYQRAVDFAKKAQELKKHDRKKEPDERRGRDFYDHHQEERPRSRHDEYRKREPEWDVDPRKRMDPNNLAKREKAADEISRRIIQKYIHQVEPEVKNKVINEIKDNIFNKIYETYGDQDISYIECIIKFNTRDARAEERIFHEAASKYSVQYRGMKRPMAAPSEIPSKMARRSPQPEVKQDSVAKPSGTIISDWTANPVELANQMALQQYYGAQQMYMNQLVPAIPTYQPPPPVPPVSEVYQPSEVPLQNDKDGFHLYLCKDTFNLFLGSEIDELKEFLVSEIFNATAMNNWAPSFIFRGLQTPYRYELITQDSHSKNWLISLDFSGFTKFKVLVYTGEELWFERVAVWLPGHSKCRYIDPFTKLQLQNRKVEGIDIGKWKFVKSIVTAMGTRLYLDVPPSAARKLEAMKSLSYELQKVNVFSKAMAVDKPAFDAGLNEKSITDETIVQNAVRSSPMPTLKNELDFVKITIKGYKTLTVADARKIKDMLVFELFKYLRLGGQSSTDFIKFGLSLPCYFGVVPANEESKKWLTQLNMGNLYRRPIVILGGEEHNVKRIPLKAYIYDCRSQRNLTYVFERLKQSNKGVKGLHFNLWKPERLDWSESAAKVLFLIDMESVETLSSLKFNLDYLDEHCDNNVKTVTFKSEKGLERLLEIIKEYKAEQNDSYDVANMDIESSETDDDIVCLGEATDPEDN